MMIPSPLSPLSASLSSPHPLCRAACGPLDLNDGSSVLDKNRNGDWRERERENGKNREDRGHTLAIVHR